jgi:hypothetical protein
MSDFDLDWGMEHELHVDHDGGVDHVLADDHHPYDQHEYTDLHDSHDADDLGEVDHQHDEPPGLDEHEPDPLDLPDWQLDTDFLDGHYDLVGADPDENDMWSQFMTDMHEEINPYAAN